MVISGAVAGNAVLAATACGSDAAPCRPQITGSPVYGVCRRDQQWPAWPLRCADQELHPGDGQFLAAGRGGEGQPPNPAQARLARAQDRRASRALPRVRPDQSARHPGRPARAALRAGRDLRRWPGSLRRSRPPTFPRPGRPPPGPRPPGAGPLPAPPATPSRPGRQGPGRPRCPPLLTGLFCGGESHGQAIRLLPGIAGHAGRSAIGVFWPAARTPLPTALDKHVHGHFRELLVLVVDKVVSADVSDDDTWQGAHELYDLVSGCRSGACAHERVASGVERLISRQGGPVRTAPQDVRRELPVIDIGKGAADARPRTRG